MPSRVSAQSRFDAGAHVAIASSDQFEAADMGIGGRFGWRPARILGIEAEITHYPTDYPDDAAFSASRWEGFVGVTAGPNYGRLRPFARLRPGWLTYREAPQPRACILIFPPPLACELAGGTTVAAFDLGGGVEFDVTARSYVRLDLGDRLLRFEGPVSTRGEVRESNFWTHDLRVSVGAGWRF